MGPAGAGASPAREGVGMNRPWLAWLAYVLGIVVFLIVAWVATVWFLTL